MLADTVVLCSAEAFMRTTSALRLTLSFRLCQAVFGAAISRRTQSPEARSGLEQPVGLRAPTKGIGGSMPIAARQ